MEPMVVPAGLGREVGRVLDAAEDASPMDAVEAVTRELGALLGANTVSLLIADLSGRALVRLAHFAAGGPPTAQAGGEPNGSPEVLPFDGGPAEQTLRSQAIKVLPPYDASDCALWTVLAPVTERGESLGLLEMCLPEEPDEATLAGIGRTAHLLAFVVIANGRHTDLFEASQRSTPFTLPAEIQRRLLPSAFTCEAGSFTLSAWLEPAANVGGDTFDYSLDRDVLHLSITDAMGHGVGSALLATLCVGSLRNTRRQGASLLEQVAAANAALVDHAADVVEEGFATGVVGRIDLRRGVLSLVNAGHVPPLLARDGVVERVTVKAGLPLGLFADARHDEAQVRLQPGDRLVFVTDGMLERNAAALDLIAEIRRTRPLHPREATRRLADNVLEITGSALADDATLLILDWHGDHARGSLRRETVAGADAG